MRGVIERVLARDPGSGEAPRTLVGFCAETPHGMWQIEIPVTDLADVRDRDEAIVALETHYDIVHVALDGTRRAYAPKERLSGYGGRVPQRPVVFDFDGDGEPELYVAVDEAGPEGHQQHEAMLVTWNGKDVVPYQPAAALEYVRARDVDHDGRPDLIVTEGYDDPLQACESGFPADWPEPLFVAHSLPRGAFSTSDAVARAHVAAWCPHAPKQIASSADALCARMWAATPSQRAAARQLVVDSCEPGFCARELAGQPQPPGATEDCERRLAWFEREPPFTLP